MDETPIRCGHCQQLRKANELVRLAQYECQTCGYINEVTNIPVSEWLGFNYSDYLEAIKTVIRKDKFSLLAAKNMNDVERGKFTKQQISTLKKVLIHHFTEGNSIRAISKDLLHQVRVKDLHVTNDQGDTIRIIPKELRSINIARTETTRTANEGSKQHYKERGITQYQWVASIGKRTCPTCEGLNGQLFNINSQKSPPAHSLCRCTVIPVVNA